MKEAAKPVRDQVPAPDALADASDANRPVPRRGYVCPLCFDPKPREDDCCWRCLGNPRSDCC